MSVDSITAGGVFRIGSVMSRAWRLFAGNIVFFLVVPVVIYGSMVIAYVIFGPVFASAGWTSGFGVSEVGAVLGRVAVLSLTMVGQGVLVLGAFQRLRGQPLRVIEVLERLLSRFMPLFGVSILWSLGLVLPVFGGALAVEVLATSLGLGHEALGLIPAVYTPSAILLVVWAVVAPACVVERLGPVASIGRSAQLTKNCRWKIFGIMALLGLSSLPATFEQMGFAFTFFWFLIWIAYWNCTVIVIYHDLRVAKEGMQSGQIVTIFD
jgi:hypothetical protein